MKTNGSNRDCSNRNGSRAAALLSRKGGERPQGVKGDGAGSAVSCKKRASYGHRRTLLGGIDVDFLYRSTEEEIRARVPRTLDAYLAMMDEGRRYSA